MSRSTRISIPALPDGSHRQAGSFDRASRWYPDRELFDIPGAFAVRSPSRAWPYSYLKHFYTTKFSKLLLATNPALWFHLQGLDPASAEASPFVVFVAERKMGVAA